MNNVMEFVVLNCKYSFISFVSPHKIQHWAFHTAKPQSIIVIINTNNHTNNNGAASDYHFLFHLMVFE